MQEELYRLFRRNFPYVLRDEQTVKEILFADGNKVFEERAGSGELIGASVLQGNTVYLLCVDSEYRHRGLGSRLLKESEDFLRREGCGSVQIGAGKEYLVPGVPTGIPPCRETLGPEALCPELIGEDAAAFFEKRGYRHAWGEANCFDMEAELPALEVSGCSIGDTIGGITYRWAGKTDFPGVIQCVEDGEPNFAGFYRESSLYEGHSRQRALVAAGKSEICGAIMVGAETDAPDTGSLGCTVVACRHRGKHIGANLTLAGTAYLKEIGLKKGFVGYTYSGLEKLYGCAGYRISAYYYMASKDLDPKLD